MQVKSAPGGRTSSVHVSSGGGGGAGGGGGLGGDGLGGGGGGDEEGGGGGGGGGDEEGAARIKHFAQVNWHALSQGSSLHLWTFSSSVPTPPSGPGPVLAQNTGFTSSHGGGGGEGDGGGGGAGAGGEPSCVASTPAARMSRETRSIASFIVWGLLSIYLRTKAVSHDGWGAGASVREVITQWEHRYRAERGGNSV